MIDTTNHDEERNPVRKLLKSLPRIPAPADFDRRLQQHLAEKESKKKTLWDVLFAPRRVPAYAYSLIAVVAAGVIVYYSYIRTGVAQQQVAPNQEEMRKAENSTRPEQDERAEQPTLSTPRSTVAQQEQSPRVTTTLRPRREPLPMVSSPRESVREGLDSRGILKEVGGTGARSTERPVDVPFIKVLPQSEMAGEWYDSIARADSMKRDSLKHVQEQKQKNSR